MKIKIIALIAVFTLFIVIISIIISFFISENIGHNTQLNNITIFSVIVDNDIFTISGVLHNSAMIFKGYDMVTLSNCLYITIKSGIIGKSAPGTSGDEIFVKECMPDYIEKIFINDCKNKQLLWSKLELTESK